MVCIFSGQRQMSSRLSLILRGKRIGFAHALASCQVFMLNEEHDSRTAGGKCIGDQRMIIVFVGT